MELAGINLKPREFIELGDGRIGLISVKRANITTIIIPKLQ